MICFCYKFTVLLPDDSLERKGNGMLYAKLITDSRF